MDKMLVGTATRYIVGRHAVQTVYWRRSTDVGARGLLKTKKTCSFGKNEGPDKISSADMFAQVRERYS